MKGSERQDGFTLVELLVSITILGVIGGSLAAAIIVTFTDTATKLRVSEAHDKQIAGVYWAPDVASAETFQTTAQCTVPSGTVLVSMRWTDDIGVRKVDYVVDGPDGLALDSTVHKTVYRYSCIDAGATSKLRVADQVTAAACLPDCSSLTSTSRTARLVLTESGSTINVDGTRRVS